MSRLALKPFTKWDWMGFAGAELFSDGSDPLIGGLVVEYEIVDVADERDCADAIVILDGEGLHIDVIDHDGDTMWSVSFFGMHAARAIAELPKVVHERVLLGMAGAQVTHRANHVLRERSALDPTTARTRGRSLAMDVPESSLGELDFDDPDFWIDDAIDACHEAGGDPESEAADQYVAAFIESAVATSKERMTTINGGM